MIKIIILLLLTTTVVASDSRAKGVSFDYEEDFTKITIKINRNFQNNDYLTFKHNDNFQTCQNDIITHLMKLKGSKKSFYETILGDIGGIIVDVKIIKPTKVSDAKFKKIKSSNLGQASLKYQKVFRNKVAKSTIKTKKILQNCVNEVKSKLGEDYSNTSPSIIQVMENECYYKLIIPYPHIFEFIEKQENNEEAMKEVEFYKLKINSIITTHSLQAIRVLLNSIEYLYNSIGICHQILPHIDDLGGYQKGVDGDHVVSKTFESEINKCGGSYFEYKVNKYYMDEVLYVTNSDLSSTINNIIKPYFADLEFLEDMKDPEDFSHLKSTLRMLLEDPLKMRGTILSFGSIDWTTIVRIKKPKFIRTNMKMISIIRMFEKVPSIFGVSDIMRIILNM
jgi:hypothetical protein